MKVAVVHEWLITHGGSEEITAQVLTMFPEAELFTLLADPVPSLRALIGERRVHTSFLQRIPGATRAHRRLLPLMPRAIESFDLRGFDLVISVSHAVAKGVRVPPGVPHLCICCSPMRYAWDLREQYLEESGYSRGVRGAAARWLLNRLQAWDLATAGRPTRYAAISAFIGDRIQRAYGVGSAVIYPPVDTAFYSPSTATAFNAEDAGGAEGTQGGRGGVPASSRLPSQFVTASRLVPYKRIPLIVEAFGLMPDLQLVVIGDGPEMDKVRAAARPNVTVLGHQPREVLRDHLRRAAGFVFAAEEDFGILPVEAMACGTPVVAYGKGGVRETVVGLGVTGGWGPTVTTAGATGVFFQEQTASAIAAAVRALEPAVRSGAITAAACRAQAERFASDAFRDGVRRELRGLGVPLG